ncbi:MAG: hypothetical protein KDC38_07335 [Planctomycetes bacterium]|nr:hypothetical protein [Planctomycetota bacterium]
MNLPTPNRRRARLARALIVAVGIGLGGSSFVESADPEAPPVDPRRQVREAVAQASEAKSLHSTWYFWIGTADSRDHEIDATRFYQEYEIDHYGRWMAIPALELFRFDHRGVIRGPKGWQIDSGHVIGRWISSLVQHPVVAIAEAFKAGKPEAITTADGPRLRVALPEKLAARHWERVVQARCLAHPGEDLSPILGRVDATKLEGSAELRIDDGLPVELWITVAVRLAPKASALRQPPKERGDDRVDYRDQEHLVVRHRYVLSRFDQVGPIEVPAEARKMLER